LLRYRFDGQIGRGEEEDQSKYKKRESRASDEKKFDGLLRCFEDVLIVVVIFVLLLLVRNLNFLYFLVT
jgi:hypothetical protein